VKASSGEASASVNGCVAHDRGQVLTCEGSTCSVFVSFTTSALHNSSMRHWRTTKDEKGFGLRDPCQSHRGKKSVYCMQRVSGYRSNPEIERASLNTTLTGIPSGTTTCRSPLGEARRGLSLFFGIPTWRVSSTNTSRRKASNYANHVSALLWD